MTARGHARRLLEKQGQELTEGIVQELEALHQELANVRTELAQLRGAPALVPGEDVFAGPATISAGEQLGPEHGFYPAEQTDAGRTFNWSGPSPQFSFDVDVDRAHGADLRLEAINFLDFDRQKDVKVFVDGLEIAASVAKDDRGVVITAVAPSRRGIGKTNVTFVLPEVLAPENPEDKRTLGLAFVSLVLIPRE